jgi:very-short-patch-repair endonuclease
MRTSMHQRANSDKFEFARKLRENPTPQESKLWNALKNKQLNGYKFRQQHPLSRFVADFYCHNARLVIEIDGGYHDAKMQKLYDDWREEVIKDFGIHILRFRNEEIENNFDEVLYKINEILMALRL